MASWQDKPQVGQTVWCDAWKNGIITAVDNKEHMVYVNHYAYGYHVHELDEFFGAFDEGLNQWVLIPL